MIIILINFPWQTDDQYFQGGLWSANIWREPFHVNNNELEVTQSALLLALERGNILEVYQALSRIPTSREKPVLLAPSKRPEHQLRTPLMAAAASGDLIIFGEWRLSLPEAISVCNSEVVFRHIDTIGVVRGSSGSDTVTDVPRSPHDRDVLPRTKMYPLRQL